MFCQLDYLIRPILVKYGQWHLQRSLRGIAVVRRRIFFDAPTRRLQKSLLNRKLAESDLIASNRKHNNVRDKKRRRGYSCSMHVRFQVCVQVFGIQLVDLAARSAILK